MSLLEAILIGIIQGATEFLPISSDGHLVLVPAVFGLSQPDLVLIGLVHAGTLLAIVSYFWRDLLAIARAVLSGLAQRQPLATADARLGYFMVLGSIPAAIVGLLAMDFFEEQFGSPNVAAVGLSLIHISFRSNEILVDIGAKSEGVIPSQETSTYDSTTKAQLQELSLIHI